MSPSRKTPKGYAQFDLDLIQLDTVVDFDIFIWPAGSKAPVLYRERNLRFGKEERKRLAEANTTQVFIVQKDAGPLSNYVERNLEAIVENPAIPIRERAKIVYDAAVRLTTEVLVSPQSEESLKRTEEMVCSAIAYVLKGKEALHHLIALMATDYTTFTHSVHVAAIGLALAEQVGFKSRGELKDFGVGAILHDVGKLKISQDILHKPGPLTNREWAEVKRHPEIGLTLLNTHKNLAAGTKAIIIEHHERVDGTGYPSGKSGDGIHPFARVAAIVDAFDALTSRRPYRGAVSSFRALGIMKEEVGSHFDEEYYKAFIRLLGK
jgi:HD-GYP domain-containing protein (c-di-GMP phosphodiesterase class II)